MTREEIELNQPDQIRRRLGVIDRLATHSRMKELWRELGKKKQNEDGDNSPEADFPRYHVNPDKYNKLLKLPEDTPIPGAWERLLWARRNIVYISARAALAPPVDLSRAAEENRHKEARRRLENFNEIISYLSRDTVLDESAFAIRTLLVHDLEQVTHPSRRRLGLDSARSTRKFQNQISAIVGISGVIFKMFKAHQHWIVAHALSAAFDIDLSRRDVENIMKSAKAETNPTR